MKHEAKNTYGGRVKEERLERVTGTLKSILEEELEAGNTISEIYEGDWPSKGTVMVFLSKPFKTPIRRELSEINYALINDPHYWKAQYYDRQNNVFLCCNFDGPNFEPL